MKIPRIKRHGAGHYTVDPLWSITKEGKGDWRVLRWKGEKSNELEKEYRFESYRQARDHALMEADVMAFIENFDSLVEEAQP